MKVCYIFGAAQGLPKGFCKGKEDLIIAADAGVLKLEKLGVTPDITVGDFDSLGFEPESGEVIKHPVRKDDTDTLLAVKVGFERGYSNFLLYGCTGKRLDHTLANLQTLSFISQNNGRAFLCGDDFTATAITNGSITFKENAKGYISVFAASGKAEGVSIKGLSYPLENQTLNFDFPLGVSNEFTGSEAEISVSNGTITIIWSGGISDLK